MNKEAVPGKGGGVTVFYLCVCVFPCISFTFSALLHPLANYTQGLFGRAAVVRGVAGARQCFLFMIK